MGWDLYCPCQVLGKESDAFSDFLVTSRRQCGVRTRIPSSGCGPVSPECYVLYLQHLLIIDLVVSVCFQDH